MLAKFMFAFSKMFGPLLDQTHIKQKKNYAYPRHGPLVLFKHPTKQTAFLL